MNGLIGELCAITAVEVKNNCEEKLMDERMVEFDDEDGMIMESLANMIEGCCLFERAILLEVRKPLELDVMGCT